jgi:hypothetical protein
MRFRRASIGLVFGLGLMAIPAEAMPFTYEFVVPAWTSTNDVSLFGTNAILYVTADNGNNITTSQTYTDMQIMQTGITANGGSLGVSGITFGNRILFAAETFLTTDSTGLSATLNPSVWTDGLTSYSGGAEGCACVLYAFDFYQSNRSNVMNLEMFDFVGSSLDVASYVSPVSSTPTFLEGTLVPSTPAPEPSTFALAGLGVAVLGACWRHARA